MNSLLRLLGGLALAGVLAIPARATVITQLAGDGSGESSFTGAGHWSDGLTPGSTNDYFTSTQIRTPGTTGSYTFGGKSLTLSTGSSIVYKGGSTAGTDVITVNDLRMQGGAISNWSGSNGFTFAGNITLNVVDSGHKGGTFDLNGGLPFTVSAAIGGAGAVTVSYSTGASQSAGAVIFTGANNTYQGGTVISNFAYLDVRANGALGTGNVTMTGGQLKLELGATSNYIADGADLLLSSSLASGAVNLAFTGSDTIAGLSFDGGSTFASAGTWGAVGSGAQFTSALFTGTGTFTVVPEVPTPALFAGGLAVVLALRGARRRASAA